MTVTALYVDPRGPYPKLCDSWDERRDARTFEGPGPVVAHPPCGPWGGLRHQYRGTEHDCAPRAVDQVRTFGGVLEHPAGSTLWGESFGDKMLPPPPDSPEHWGADRDMFGGFTIAIDQVEWGHVARKPTWLYLVGVDVDFVRAGFEARPYPGRAPTHWCSGSRSNKNGGSVPNGIKVCSAQQRRRTPLALAKWLIELASKARGAPVPRCTCDTGLALCYTCAR